MRVSDHIFFFLFLFSFDSEKWKKNWFHSWTLWGTLFYLPKPHTATLRKRCISTTNWRLFFVSDFGPWERQARITQKIISCISFNYHYLFVYAKCKGQDKCESSNWENINFILSLNQFKTRKPRPKFESDLSQASVHSKKHLTLGKS